MTYPDPLRTGAGAVITDLRLDRSAVLPGESVTLHWRARGAELIRIVRPDGDVFECDARLGVGEHRFTVTCSGALRVTAFGWRDASPEHTVGVTAYEFPYQVAVPVPMPELPKIVLGGPATVAADSAGISAALIASGRPGTVLPVARRDRGLVELEQGGPPCAALPASLSVVPERLHARPELAETAWARSALVDGPARRTRRAVASWFRRG